MGGLAAQGLAGAQGVFIGGFAAHGWAAQGLAGAQGLPVRGGLVAQGLAGAQGLPIIGMWPAHGLAGAQGLPIIGMPAAHGLAGAQGLAALPFVIVCMPGAQGLPAWALLLAAMVATTARVALPAVMPNASGTAATVEIQCRCSLDILFMPLFLPAVVPCSGPWKGHDQLTMEIYPCDTGMSRHAFLFRVHEIAPAP